MRAAASVPINALPLLPVLDQHLLALLRSLAPANWQRPTLARQWTVKDVAAHLLDGNLRTLAMPAEAAATPAAELSLPPAVAWKLFTKALRPAEARPLATLRGEVPLAEAALHLLAVMA